ncbi:hypothetical protein V6N13_083319 [Hibiscus sabdariffa]|uniref:Uncharacterized protein n=1 Tax=Hibiscus sabdariffa TaxID=183260 RepID=A0ABR2SXN9_9ROSI
MSCPFGLLASQLIFKVKGGLSMIYSFLSMLRTLFWIKAASSGWLVLEQTWLYCPLLCSPSKHSHLPRLGGKPGHGNCSGVLRNQLGNVATLFSGLLGVIDSNVAELITIRTGNLKINRILQYRVV